MGKAVNLKDRVGSYFAKNVFSAKTRLLVRAAVSLDYIRVDSDIEALLLEANLIKKHQPYFNHQLKDDKDYLYIIITKEDYPRVTTGRKRDLAGAKEYFGPFTSASAARTTLKIARRIFSFRTGCRPNSARACLGFHLGLCPGVCVGALTKKDYQKILRKLIKFLSGDTRGVVDELEKEMRLQAKNLEFEEATKTKTKIEAIAHITKRVEDVEKYLEGPAVLESFYERQLANLTQVLKLKEKPLRIECYDISNIMGTNATGSMVVLTGGQISKDDYRRFRIKTLSTSNDFAMMAEVLGRRFKNDWEHPNLIVVDGGKGQLSVALSVLRDLDLKIPVVGLAKKLEEIYLPNEKKPLRLERSSPALQLLQRIRDESHRFALRYHRYLRSKQLLNLVGG